MVVEATSARATGKHIVVEAVLIRAGGAGPTGAFGGLALPGQAIQAAREVEARSGCVEQAADALTPGPAVVLEAR